MRSTVAILGTGLIGTSLGLALRKGSGRSLRSTAAASPRLQIVGWDTRPSNARSALKRGGISKIANSMEDAVRDASTVVIATPLDSAIEMAPRVIASAARGCLVIDVTPVKVPMLRAVGNALRSRRDVGYVSTHPMAGREKGGPSYADAALFQGRPMALVAPPSPRSQQALRRAEALAKKLGALPLRMTARAHDRAVAVVSALPQLAAIALTLAAAADKRSAKLAGPGFRDMTRLAMSPFDIWKPAIASNRREIVRCLRALERATTQVGAAARQGDIRAMERLFSKARAARKRVGGV